MRRLGISSGEVIELTESDLLRCNVTGLLSRNYIRVGSSYYQPVALPAHTSSQALPEATLQEVKDRVAGEHGENVAAIFTGLMLLWNDARQHVYKKYEDRLNEADTLKNDLPSYKQRASDAASIHGFDADNR